MPITVLDCAAGAQAIYKNQDIPNFSLLRGFYDPKNMAVGDSGYSVGLYQYTPNANTYMVSIRGSAKGKTTKDWMDDDLSIGVGRTPDRNHDSLHYIWRLQHNYGGNSFIILVGHSLGGWMCQYIGVVCDLPFITFNAPPALSKPLVLSRFRQASFPDGTLVGNFRQGLNFRVNYDPVSKISGGHVGPLVELPLSGQNHAAAHKMSVVVPSVIASGLGGNSAYREIAQRNGWG